MSLVLIDVATRFVFLRPLPNKEMETVAQVIFKIFCDVGFPVIISMDNGTEFVNQVMAQIVDLSRMDRRLFTPYHHRGNGITERAVRTSSEAIYKQLEGHDKEWDLYLPAVQLYMNLKTSDVTGSTPYSLMFSRAANKFMETESPESPPADIEVLRERLQQMTEVVYPAIQKRSDKVHDKRNAAFAKNNQIRHEDFPDGAVVMALDDTKKGKSEPKYEGPFTVMRRNQGGVYVLKGREGTVYTRPGNVLKAVHPEILGEVPNQDQIAVVQYIMNHKTGLDGAAYYEVKWKGTKLRSWVKHSDFNDHGPIRKYWQKKDQSAKEAIKKARKLQATIGQRHLTNTEEPEQDGTPGISDDNGLALVTQEHTGTQSLDREKDSENQMTQGKEPNDSSLPKDLQSDLSSTWAVPAGPRKRVRFNYSE